MSGPAQPALRVFDQGVGIPHAHGHPPSHVPPAAPVPIPFGFFVLPVPFMSGAKKTLVEMMPAARCPDMGVNAWCGGLFPFTEVSFGSNSVFIEGQRAARQAADNTMHCRYAGPTAGSVAPAGSVEAGSEAQTDATAHPLKGQGVFEGRTPNQAIQALLDEGAIQIHSDDPEFRAAILRDLQRIAETGEGQALLNSLQASGKPTHIRDPRENARCAAPCAKATSHVNAQTQFVVDADGDRIVLGDGASNYAGRAPERYDRVRQGGTGAGSETDVYVDPNNPPPGASSDVVLFHELGHADNSAHGRQQLEVGPPEASSSDSEWSQQWTNSEEYDATNRENRYRSEREPPLPPRTSHAHL